jgi:hypothetical protein
MMRFLAVGLVFVAFATGFSIAAVKLAGGPARNSSPESVPPPAGTCPPARVAPDTSPAVRAGAYYFDGWANQVDDFHFRGLVGGPYAGREPLYGWRDNTRRSMELQLGWAHRYGIGFFAFDWYYRPDRTHSPLLNHALALYRGLRRHRGVDYALTYVNTDTGEDFVVPPSHWPQVVQEWVRRDLTQPNYVRVAGKPLLIVLDVQRFTRQFGGPGGVNRALGILRRKAVAAGLPGVFVVGGVYVDPQFDWNWLRWVAGAEHFDAFTQYAAPAAAGSTAGERPYPVVVRAMRDGWANFSSAGAQFIPSVMVGWDPRPWQLKVNGRLWWFRRTPGQVGAFVADAVRFADANPVVPATPKPLILLEAWNELGEGAFLTPTVGACHRYGEAVARALAKGTG